MKKTVDSKYVSSNYFEGGGNLPSNLDLKKDIFMELQEKSVTLEEQELALEKSEELHEELVLSLAHHGSDKEWQE